MKKDKGEKKQKVHKMLQPELLQELNQNLSELIHATSGHHHWPRRGLGLGFGQGRGCGHGPGHGNGHGSGHGAGHGPGPMFWGMRGRPMMGRFCGRRRGHFGMNDEEDFVVKANLRDYRRCDMSVKMVDNFVVIEAKHDEREDEEGFVTRHFKKRYPVPEGFDTEKIHSTLSCDGTLIVRAPKIVKDVKERAVEIVELPESDSEDDVEEVIAERLHEMET